jgi:hypothetical protein
MSDCKTQCPSDNAGELERSAVAAAVAEAKQDADRTLAIGNQKIKPTLSVATLIGPYLFAGSCQGPDIIEVHGSMRTSR